MMKTLFRSARCCRLLVVGLLASMTTANAAAEETPLPFGLKLTYNVPAQALPSPEPAPQLGSLSELAEAQARIASLEVEGGPYNPALASPLLEAAAQAREMGLTDTAAELYAWALHNTRVNQGLGSDTQLPIVESLLELHRAQGDLEAIDNREGYLYRLSGAGQAPFDDAKLKSAIRYLDWRISRLEDQDWEGRGRAALNLWDDAEDLAQAVCVDPDFAQAWCAQFTQRQLGVLYAIDYHINSPEGDELRINMRTRRTPDEYLGDERLIQLERNSYRSGVRAIESALEQLPDDEELQLALADWRWFQGRRGYARDVYRKLMVTRPEWFKEPVPLPVIPSLAMDPITLREPEPVTVTLRVNKSGRSRDVTFIDEASLSDSVRIRAGRALRDMRFRPALNSEGESIEASLRMDLISIR